MGDVDSIKLTVLLNISDLEDQQCFLEKEGVGN